MIKGSRFTNIGVRSRFKYCLKLLSYIYKTKKKIIVFGKIVNNMHEFLIAEIELNIVMQIQ